MPRLGSTLSNCYVPAPVVSSNPTKTTINPNRRPSGDGNTTTTSTTTTTNATRNSRSLRRLCIDRSILTSSSGSSLVEIGHTKVICAVHGPRPAATSSLAPAGTEFHSGGVLHCEVRYAPFFGVRPETRVSAAPTSLDGHRGGDRGGGEEAELSSRLHDAIVPSIPLDLLRKNVVDVFVTVLQNDGGALGACVVAASLALADSGVELYDTVAACSVAVVPRSLTTADGGAEDPPARPEQKGAGSYCLLADPSEEEIMAADGVVTLAMMPNWKEVTFWDQTGRLPMTTASDASDLCRDGCAMMQKFMRQTLVG